MYNLLVTAMDGAWDKGFYEYDNSRFLEYTNEKLASALKGLSESHIENLKSYPCLFAYEGGNSDVRIGHFTSIKKRGRKILIEFEYQQDIDPIPFSQIQSIATLLDIRSWEMNRTHWAVKDEDLFARLRAGEILDQDRETRSSRQERPMSEKSTNPKVNTVKGFIGKVLT